MLNILSSGSRFCDGISRRDFLRIGGLGAAGLAVPDLFRARQLRANASAGAGAGFGKAKSCILLFLAGGPPHHETFDPKPDAPAEVRGELKPIATNVAGVQVSELLPLVARQADKYAIVRSVYNNGGVTDIHFDAMYLALTGHKNPKAIPDATPPEPHQYPSIGSALARCRPAVKGLPASVILPKKYSQFAEVAGQNGGFLGKKYDPFALEIPYSVDNPADPKYLDYQIPAITLPGEVTLGRLNERQHLLSQIDLARAEGAGAQRDSHQQKALDMIGSSVTRQAFDLKAEPAALRDRYRRHIIGQGALLARRLVEHGVPLVTVMWRVWDLHYDIAKHCKVLLPELDQVFSALLDDLSARGLLDETLVVCMGEFGRAPLIEPGRGRSHWGRCYSVVMAGGGIRGGQVYGSSDSRGASPRDKPVGTSDIVTTIYHCLGIDPDTELPDQFGRPLRLCQGEAIQGLF